jgi:hypothetical protein
MSVRFQSMAAVMFAAVLAAAPAAAAQSGSARRGATAPIPPAAPAPPGALSNDLGAADQRVIFSGDETARQTKERLKRLLEQYPPTLAQVLRRDPSLLHNEPYLAPYPALAAFLGQHPEVAHNPAYFLDTQLLESYADTTPNPVRDKARAVADVAQIMGVITGFLGFFTLLGWVLKTVVDYRRWTKMLKVQTDTHNKLMDRLTSNEDVLAYIQSPAAQRYLDAAGPVSKSMPITSAPYSRILWSVQAGTVAIVVGVGFLFVSNRWALDPDWSGEFSRLLFLMGVVVLATGAGLALSGLVSYLLSRRLGLFPAASSSHA